MSEDLLKQVKNAIDIFEDKVGNSTVSFFIFDNAPSH